MTGIAPWRAVWRELPAEEQRAHEVLNMTDLLPLEADLVLACRCGWRHRVSGSRLALMYARGMGALEELFAEAASAAKAHLMERLALYHPRLADLTEWGWFSPEVW